MVKILLTFIFFVLSFNKAFAIGTDAMSEHLDFNEDRSCRFHSDPSDHNNEEVEDAITAINGLIPLSFLFLNNFFDADVREISFIDNKTPDNQIYIPTDVNWKDYSGYSCLEDYLWGYILWRASLEIIATSCGASFAMTSRIRDSLDNKDYNIGAAFASVNPAMDFILLGSIFVQCSGNPIGAVLLSSAAVIVGYISDAQIKKYKAQQISRNLVLCGHNWQLWGGDGKEEAATSYEGYSSSYKFDKVGYNDSQISNGYYNFLYNSSADEVKRRELIYGGVERRNFNCEDVLAKAASVSTTGIEGEYPQLYYFRGSEAANYNCNRYHPREYRKFINNTEVDITDFKEAYDCCIKYQTRSVCVENLANKFEDSDKSTKLCLKVNAEDDSCYYKHCLFGEECQTNFSSEEDKKIVGLDLYESSTKLCAITNDNCPFNIPIALGAEKCVKYKDLTVDAIKKIAEYKSCKKNADNTLCDEPGAKNACTLIYDESEATYDTRYNSKEDTKLRVTREWEVTNGEYNCNPTKLMNKCKNYCALNNHCVEITPAPKELNSDDYSAFFSTACLDFKGDSQVEGALLTPVAQCFRETIYNFFFNKAGRTTGGYNKGDIVMDDSFIVKMQDLFRDIIKMAMIIAVVLLGVGILLGVGEKFDKKNIIFLVAKFAIISWLALGDGWQKVFFDSIYNTSTTFVSLVNSINKDSSASVAEDEDGNAREFIKRTIYKREYFQYKRTKTTTRNCTVRDPVLNSSYLTIDNNNNVKLVYEPSDTQRWQCVDKSFSFNLYTGEQHNYTLKLNYLKCNDHCDIHVISSGQDEHIIGDNHERVSEDCPVTTERRYLPGDSNCLSWDYEPQDRCKDMTIEEDLRYLGECQIAQPAAQAIQLAMWAEAGQLPFCRSVGYGSCNNDQIHEGQKDGRLCYETYTNVVHRSLFCAGRSCTSRRSVEDTVGQDCDIADLDDDWPLNKSNKNMTPYLTENKNNIIKINFRQCHEGKIKAKFTYTNLILEDQQNQPTYSYAYDSGNADYFTQYFPELNMGTSAALPNPNLTLAFDLKNVGSDFEDCSSSGCGTCSEDIEIIAAISKTKYDFETTYYNDDQSLMSQQPQGEDCLVPTTNFLSKNEEENYYEYADESRCTEVVHLQHDGCYFHPKEYEDGSQYLAIWDTMDCKIQLYLGLGVNQWGIVALIISSVFSGIWGMYLAIATLAFGIFVFVLAANILHMFIYSSFLLVLLVFISPITITLSLFSATRKIFQDWLKEFISFALQPIILFFAMAFAIILFDKFMLGDARFINAQQGSYNIKSDDIRFNIDYICNQYGAEETSVNDAGEINCERGGEIFGTTRQQYCEDKLWGLYSEDGACKNAFIPPNKRPYQINCYGVEGDSKSPACVLNKESEGGSLLYNLASIPARVIFPAIGGAADAELKNMAITMLEAAIFMYIISMFISSVPTIAATLTNGSKLIGTEFDVKSIIKQGADFSSGAAKRFSNSMKRETPDDKEEDSEEKNKAPIKAEDPKGENKAPITADDAESNKDDSAEIGVTADDAESNKDDSAEIGIKEEDNKK